MDSAVQKLQAAQKLLMEPTTTREKISTVLTLLEGVHPRIDSLVRECQKHLSIIGKIEEGDVIGLSADHLPESTEEEKKRKRAFLLLLNTWRQLKSEVARVQAEMQSMQNAETGADKVSVFGRIFGIAKGPLGITTIIAAGIVLTMQQTSVDITIQNKGCGTMQAGGSVPISIPGLKLPQGDIPNGGSAVATIPPVSITVDGTKTGAVTLRALSYSLNFNLPNNIDDVTFNGASLLEKKTDIKLSEQDAHTLTLQCS